MPPLYRRSQRVPFNSLCLGFFHASKAQQRDRRLRNIFQFPLLGIFPCIKLNPSNFAASLMYLSIPFAWDFSMHLGVACLYQNPAFIFQFPLLGIFPCICCWNCWMKRMNNTFNSLCLGFFHASLPDFEGKVRLILLSIPFAWDFSMHL